MLAALPDLAASRAQQDNPAGLQQVEIYDPRSSPGWVPSLIAE